MYILKTYKDKSLFSDSEPEDENRTTDGDDGDGGKEHSNNECKKDDKGTEDENRTMNDDDGDGRKAQ